MRTKYNLQNFQSKKVLITGGAGFIGSNLAIKLISLGAEVTLVDNFLEGFGGNKFNIEPIKNDVNLIEADIRDESTMEKILQNKEYIFHLAGLNDHVAALKNPYPDLEVNIIGTTKLLETLKKVNQDCVIVYGGTRAEYGPSTQLPVNEEAATNPKGLYEISALTAQKIFLFYGRSTKIKPVCLRLTNLYGPRAQIKHNRTGVASWFVRELLVRKKIPIMGEGKILRDFLYVDDAVEAMLGTALTEECYHEILNVGDPKPMNFVEYGNALIKAAGFGELEFIPMSVDRKTQEPGDYYSDIQKINSKTGWQPTTKLEDGVKKTLKFYTENLNKYL